MSEKSDQRVVEIIPVKYGKFDVIESLDARAQGVNFYNVRFNGEGFVAASIMRNSMEWDLSTDPDLLEKKPKHKPVKVPGGRYGVIVSAPCEYGLVEIGGVAAHFSSLAAATDWLRKKVLATKMAQEFFVGSKSLNGLITRFKKK